ncbi:MAG TPA: YicC/YloC family endoribonuclease [Nitrospirota bacterium]|nr:YicC/YloC family endoribonuclease [Nitrospirota bacterium]
MIRSMTGFGKGEGGGYVVEMRSVNHKFLDLSLKLPRTVMPLEARLKKVIGEKFSRGRIDVYVTSGGSEEAPKTLKLDPQAAKQYIAVLSELKSSFDIPGEVDLGLLTSFKDIITEEEDPRDVEEAWDALLPALAAGMSGLDRMRLEEGAALSDEISKRAGTIAALLAEVEKKAPLVVKEYAGKLKERVDKLAQGMELDPGRLMQEVAVYADRCDITEETVRAKSHLGQLAQMLSEGGPIGRKLDFMLQEINREVNTIGSKASDYEIARTVVEMKGELEKMREQVQNIE